MRRGLRVAGPGSREPSQGLWEGHVELYGAFPVGAGWHLFCFFYWDYRSSPTRYTQAPRDPSNPKYYWIATPQGSSMALVNGALPQRHYPIEGNIQTALQLESRKRRKSCASEIQLSKWLTVDTSVSPRGSLISANCGRGFLLGRVRTWSCSLRVNSSYTASNPNLGVRLKRGTSGTL